jgi:hypothetical protein
LKRLSRPAMLVRPAEDRRRGRTSNVEREETHVSIGRALRRGSDRRSAKRVPVNHVFMHGRALAGSLDLDTRIDLVCLDVSETGCLAMCGRRAPSVGDLVRLQLSPTSGRSAGFRARVVRTARDPQGRTLLAFLFEQLSAADRMRILDWHAWWSTTTRPSHATGEDERTAAINAAISAARRALDGTPPVRP